MIFFNCIFANTIQVDPLGITPNASDFNVIEVDSFANLNIADFKNIDNVFKIKGDPLGTTIVNKRRMNMLERFGGNEFKMNDLRDHIENEDDEWIEIKSFEEPIVSVGPRLPLTNCLNQRYGDGGSLEFGLGTAFLLVETVDSDRVVNLIVYYHKFKEKFELQWAVAVTLGYGCNVPKGKVGQMFITPYMAQFSDVQTRTIKIVTTRGWFRKKKRKFKIGKWKVENPVSLFDIRKSPIIQCVTDESLLDCHGKLKGKFRIF
ncbi:uncharacterized protein SPAPADRAFT_66995 [Spathaspora passalidarum NRRL Y-27907]|uniref:Uncharacterized protein n=1 Tax=Spathaspora passalidarum (strain NRRL Y-27907 / 11-Y1) TaxID=619300 RepID=G3AMW0_SPAPN|nr:uncharacterized protein SPAPADRAFT_66995 [Spathaspora passalidarum NRRL Y-27907]EGW32374.1 hypothetical protein SPAPADRAFT_66995 [Spathaspora passalidarum NRRL Y-27907]